MSTSYPKYVGPSIARELFGVTTDTLRRWAKAGKIGFIRTPGGRYRYDISQYFAVDPVPVAKVAKVRKAPLMPEMRVSERPPEVAAREELKRLDPAALRSRIEALASAPH
jgi:excisionase family DNA binding protein